jgi:SAM-dependent methyltransferase
MIEGESTYDVIGRSYGQYRRPDPRIARFIHAALGTAASVLNVGAGVGSYEPRDRRVIAVEPSRVMIDQRPPGSPPVIRAHAEALPFRNVSFDATMAILTVHHWHDLEKGLSELRRVTRDRMVILTWDPAHLGFWLTRDYFPEILEIDRQIIPSLARIERLLGPCDVQIVPIPYDCTDGFLGAYWARPHAYLDPNIRAAISAFARISSAHLRTGLDRLKSDLAQGRWSDTNADLLGLTELDLGYRLLVGHTTERNKLTE